MCRRQRTAHQRFADMDPERSMTRDKWYGFMVLLLRRIRVRCLHSGPAQEFWAMPMIRAGLSGVMVWTCGTLLHLHLISHVRPA